MSPAPTRHDVRSQLSMLARGDITPESASLWAMTFVVENDGEAATFDEATWTALTALGAADTKDADGYLYGPEDFVRWQREYQQAAGLA